MAFQKRHIPWNKGRRDLKAGPWLGKHLSIEHRRRLSDAHRGKETWNKGLKGAYKHSDETKSKMSLGRKGCKNSFYGKTHTEETRKRLSMVQTGKKRGTLSEQHRRRIMWMSCPIRFLGTAGTAAQYIFETARTEQEGGKHIFCEHGGKTKRTASESMAYIVSSIPNVGAVLAKALLLKFGSVEAVITAPAEKLAEVEGIGIKTAESIRRIVGGTYFGGE